MREAIARQHIAQAMDGFAVTVKIRKRHRHYLTTEDSEKIKNRLKSKSKKLMMTRSFAWGLVSLCVPL
jgi:hypothetical protein